MISPTKTAEKVVLDGLQGERRSFTIKATGKAFRTLIDGLYENKIGAVVREIISNGVDSHAAAGTPNYPLSITVPTAIDPTFRVRDYGVSMSHDTIMNLYSTIFDSTKENTNDEVGQFGLGSKSPFAYTDTFSVTAWNWSKSGKGEKRVYVAHISDDDVPQITHVVTEEDDEPQGVQVAIPVKPHDVQRFREEISRMVLALDTRPVLDGLQDSDIPKPVGEGDGWRVIRDVFNMGRVAIRMGCVLYPVRSLFISYVNHGYTTIVDVPIGSVDVTASRETLSLTPETEEYVKQQARVTEEKIEQYANALKAQFKNRLEAFQRSNEHPWLAIRLSPGHIDLNPDQRNSKVPGQVVETLTSKTKSKAIQRIQEPHQLIVVVDRGEKILRKRLRLGAYWEANRFSRKVVVTTPEALPRLVRILGLRPDQIVSINSLPDVEVVRKWGGSGSGTYAAPKTKTFPRDKFYLNKVGQKTINWHKFGWYIRHSDELHRIDSVLATLGIDRENILFLTKKQAEQMGAPESAHLDVELVKRATKYAKKHNLAARVEAEETASAIAEKLNTFELCRRIANKVTGLSYYDRAVQTIAEQIEEALTPTLPTTGITADEEYIRHIAGIEVDVSLQVSQIESKIEEMIEPYIPLFNDGDPIKALLDHYTRTIKEESE